MTRLIRIGLIVGWLAAVLPLAVMVRSPVQAQENSPAIHLMDTVWGTLDDQTPEARWQFEAEAGDRVSLVVQALGGDLDPYVQVIDSAGRTLAENDDIAYPARLDAALEGLEIPRRDSYTVRVTRFGFEGGSTQGDFVLSLLPAYADPVWWEDFDGARAWSANGSELVDVASLDGQLELAVQASNALVWAAPDDAVLLPLRA